MLGEGEVVDVTCFPGGLQHREGGCVPNGAGCVGISDFLVCGGLGCPVTAYGVAAHTAGAEGYVATGTIAHVILEVVVAVGLVDAQVKEAKDSEAWTEK